MSDTISRAYADAVSAIGELAEEARRNDHAFQIDTLKVALNAAEQMVDVVIAERDALQAENDRLNLEASK